MKLPTTFQMSHGEAVECAVHAYREAAEAAPGGMHVDRRVRLMKKEGNALNIFGIDVTNAIISMVTAASAAPIGRLVEHADTVNQLADRAEIALSAAVDAFQRSGDSLNEALVCCNLAKLMRARGAADAAFNRSADPRNIEVCVCVCVCVCVLCYVSLYQLHVCVCVCVLYFASFT